jgi:hypothetical protein
MGSCGEFLIPLDATTFAATSARTVSRSQTDPAFASCLQSSPGRYWRTRGSGRRSRDFERAGPLVVTVRFGRGQSTADCSQQKTRDNRCPIIGLSKTSLGGNRPVVERRRWGVAQLAFIPPCVSFS